MTGDISLIALASHVASSDRAATCLSVRGVRAMAAEILRLNGLPVPQIPGVTVIDAAPAASAEGGAS